VSAIIVEHKILTSVRFQQQLSVQQKYFALKSRLKVIGAGKFNPELRKGLLEDDKYLLYNFDCGSTLWLIGV
jgi:hypothetical protein